MFEMYIFTIICYKKNDRSPFLMCVTIICYFARLGNTKFSLCMHVVDRNEQNYRHFFLSSWIKLKKIVWKSNRGSSIFTAINLICAEEFRNKSDGDNLQRKIIESRRRIHEFSLSRRRNKILCFAVFLRFFIYLFMTEQRVEKFDHV